MSINHKRLIEARIQNKGGNTMQGSIVKKGSVYYLNFKPEQDKDWQALAKKYTDETGVEVNNLIFKTFGLGAFYRLGAYSEEKFQDNFYLKLTVNLNFL